MYRNRLINDFSREELEELFLQEVKELDDKGKKIKTLEEELNRIEAKNSRIEQDINDPTKQKVNIRGKYSQYAFRDTQKQAKNLKEQIESKQLELARAEADRDAKKREYKYFLSLLSNDQRQKLKGNSKSVQISDIIEMIDKLNSMNTDPLNVNRLNAARLILTNQIKEAEQPMRKIMEIIGTDEHFDVFDCIDTRKDIKRREQEIEELNQKLAAQKMQQARLDEQHKECLKQYQIDAENNQKRLKELMDLRHIKEEKETDSARLGELKIIESGLLNEINQLKNNIENLKNSNEEKDMQMKKQLNEQYDNLVKEVNDLKENNEKQRASNENINKLKEKLEKENEKMVDEIQSLESDMNTLQKECYSIGEKLSGLLTVLEEDPFSRQEFITFLDEIKKSSLSFPVIEESIKNTEKIEGKIKQLNEKIDKYSGKLKEKKQLISEKTEEVKNLELKLEKLNITAPVQNIEMTYEKGANDITITAKDVVSLPDDYTAIIVSFLDFQFDNSFFGDQRANIFLTIDFYTCKSEQTNPVSIFDKTFSPPILFRVKNDYELKDYIERNKIPIKLYKIVGMKYTEIAEGFISLAPMLEDILAFTTNLIMTDSKSRNVGHVKVEVESFKPIFK